MNPRTSDILLCVAAVGVLTVVVSADQGRSQPMSALAYAWTVGLGLLLLARRTYPRLVLALTALGFFTYYAAGFPAIGVAVPVAAALFSAAEAGYVVAASVTATVVLAGSTAFRLAAGQDPAYVVGYELISHVLLIVAVIALGHNLRVSRRLRRRNEQISLLVTHQGAMDDAARARDDRLRLARDLHDSIGHSLSVAALYSDVAREAGDADLQRQALIHVRHASADALSQLRRTVAVLRGREDASQTPSIADIATLVKGPMAAGFDVTLELPDRATSPVIAATVFRVVQEAVTNTLRHSTGSRLQVRVSIDDDDVVHLLVGDDGHNPRGAGSRTGHGISGMRERVQELGGTFDINAGPEGWQVIASIPKGRST